MADTKANGLIRKSAEVEGVEEVLLLLACQKRSDLRLARPFHFLDQTKILTYRFDQSTKAKVRDAGVHIECIVEDFRNKWTNTGQLDSLLSVL